MKASELRALGTEELRARLDETREELMRLRFQFTMGQLTDVSRLKLVRRDVARIATLLREREEQAEPGKEKAS